MIKAEQQAILFAERYGIIEYKVRDNKMIYFESFNESRDGKKTIYKCIVDLLTGKETRGITLRRI